MEDATSNKSALSNLLPFIRSVQAKNKAKQDKAGYNQTALKQQNQMQVRIKNMHIMHEYAYALQTVVNTYSMYVGSTLFIDAYRTINFYLLFNVNDGY